MDAVKLNNTTRLDSSSFKMVQQQQSSNNSGNNPTTTRLLASSLLDGRDDLDDRHDRCLGLVTSLTLDKSAKDAFDSLSSSVSKDSKSHDDICVGLVAGILSSLEEVQANKYYHDLTLVSRDGLVSAVNHLNHLVLDKYFKLLPVAKQQLMWLTREMVRNNVNGMDSLVWNLMRQIAGGDVTRNNLWLADSLLDILVEQRQWLDKHPFMVASVAYTYLRLIEDHCHANFDKLREKEVKFVVALVRERFNDVAVIGRDLCRVLQYVARIPEIETLWRDIQFSPKTLSPTFTGGVTQLMQTRTSRRFLQSRITPEMEKKLVFLTSQVRFGSHKRYQDWFQRQYLSTPESQSLRCDLIRFIVGVIHPTNELLCSDIIPRWAVIGWLLTTCTSQVAASNAKLALFYDWLFFEPDKDNIMNIEPAILVMHHSIKPHPAITATLLDFLCRIVTNFHPREQERVRSGIYNSLRQILDKRVLQSLGPLFDNPRLDRELRSMLRDRFSPFVASEPPILTASTTSASSANPAFSDEDEDEHEPKYNDHNDDDEDEDVMVHHLEAVVPPPPILTASKKRLKKKIEQQEMEIENENANEDLLDDDVKALLRDLKTEDEVEIGGQGEEHKCEIMDQLVQHVISEEFNYEQCNALASQLSDVLSYQFTGKLYPAELPCSPEAVEDSIGKPLFVIFRSLCDLADGEAANILLQVLAELYTLQPRVGYYLLYFLAVDSQAQQRDVKAKGAVYKDLCETIDSKYSLDICLVNDMRQCQEDDDVDLFVLLASEAYTNFPKATVGNVDLLYLIVSCVDGRQVQRLVCHVLAKDFVMFKKDCYSSVLQASLSWETFEQYVLWQLLAAHDFPIDCVISMVPKMNYAKHAEALTAVLLRLKNEKPSADLLRHLLAREVHGQDKFVASLMSFWMLEYEDKLADLVANHLSKQAIKRKKESSSGGITSQMSHSAELTLSHLDQLRQTCRQYEFFNQLSIQKALQQVRHSCTDSQKKKFMDLFALADSESEDEAEKVRIKRAAKRASKKNKAANNHNNSSNSETATDEDEKPLRPNKRKATAARSSGGGVKRKRTANKVSYKEMESTDSDSDEDDEISSVLEASAAASVSAASSSVKKTPPPPSSSSSSSKKRKKATIAAHSDSD